MDILSSLLVVGFAALVHTSFQLSVSVLTLMSGHAISAKKSHRRLLRLTTGYIAGAKIATLLLVSTISLVILDTVGTQPPELLWAVTCGLLVGIGIAVWAFYYRKGKGTGLWIPRSFARHLETRSKATDSAAESFSLGLSTVMSEILFIIGPLFVAGLTLVTLPPLWQLVGIAIYTIMSTLSLLIVWVLISGGHSLSKIQKWREANKRFLQFVGSSGLLILGFYAYVTEVLARTAGGM